MGRTNQDYGILKARHWDYTYEKLWVSWDKDGITLRFLGITIPVRQCGRLPPSQTMLMFVSVTHRHSQC